MTTSPPNAVVGSLMRAGDSADGRFVARLSQAAVSSAGMVMSRADGAGGKDHQQFRQNRKQIVAEIVMAVPGPPSPAWYGPHDRITGRAGFSSVEVGTRWGAGGRAGRPHS